MIERHSENVQSNDLQDRAILRVIAFILQEVTKEGNLLTSPNLQLTRFHTLSPPCFSILNYLEHLKERSLCNINYFFVALIYLDNLIKDNTSIQIMPNTVHKLFLASILTASAFHTDIALNNSA